MKLTTAQAIIQFLKNQYVERDGVVQQFFGGCFGIFGHGNIAGIGQALQQNLDFRYYQCRNEQSMVHTAAAFAKMKNRLQTMVCTTSIGPGATDMITGAAAATINRLPVLLLPGDSFARRNVAPVLQQLESEHTQDISVNDCFKPISRFWDRINRPEQILFSLPEAMRVLTSPSDTGAVTLALPQDVQSEAFDFPELFFRERIWRVPRHRPDAQSLHRAASAIRTCKKPIIIAGGGVIYADATKSLVKFIEATGIPVAETMAGKGSLHHEHPLCLGAMGATGTLAANHIAHDADLIIGIGTRYSDFTTASKTAFQNPHIVFVNINVAEFDSHKHSAIALTGDAQVTLDGLLPLLAGWHVEPDYANCIKQLRAEWDAEVQRLYDIRLTPLPSQGELIGAVNDIIEPDGVMVCAAGSLPGDLHKLWRAAHSKQYHLEYGFSTMGYEIAGGLGVKMAEPHREVVVMVGDGSYFMLSAEIVTSVQENMKLVIVLIDNDGYKSIGGLSRSLGQSGFGTRYQFRIDSEIPSDEPNQPILRLPVDLAANARSLGAHVIECISHADFRAALYAAKHTTVTTVIYIRNDRYASVPGYATWWDVPVAEVSEIQGVREARAAWETMRPMERVL